MNLPALRSEPLVLDPSAAEYTAGLIDRLRLENEELHRVIAERTHELNQLRVRLRLRGEA